MADQQIKTELVGDAGGLLGALAKAAEGIKGFAGGVKTQFDAATGSTSKYTAELKTMESRVESLREEWLKLKALQTSGGGGDLIGAQVKGAEQALTSAERELAAFSKRAGAGAEEVNHLENAMAGVRGVSPELSEGLEAVSSRLGVMGPVGGGPVGIAVAGLAALAAAGAAVVASLIEITKHTAEQADEAGKTAQKIGVNVEAWTQLKYAADLADVSAEGLEKGLGQLAKNMQETIWSPSSAAARTFEQLGIQATDAEGKLRPLQDVLLEVSDRFRDMPDGPEKTAAAMNLFGKSGKDLIPLLNQGKTSIAAMMVEAKQLGVTFSKEDAEAAESFNDNSKRLDLVMQGLKNTIGKDLLPTLVDLAQGAVDFAKDVIPYIVGGIHWLATEFYLTMQASNAFIDSLVTGAKQAGTIISTLFKASAQAQSGNLTGAKDTLEQGWATLKQQEAEHNAFLVADAKDTQAKIKRIWSQSSEAAEGPAKKGGGGGKGDGAGAGVPVPLMWTAADQAALAKKQEAVSQGLAELRALYGTYLEGQEQLRLQEIAEEEKDLQTKLRNGEISSDQYIAMLTAFENKRYEIALAGLRRRLDAQGLEPVEQAKILNQIELMTEAHGAKLRQIQGQRDQALKTEAQGLATTIRSVDGALTQGLQAAVTTSGPLLTRLGALFRGFTNLAIQAFSQLISKTLIWRAVTIAANNGVISSENARRVATLLGIQADTAGAAAVTAKAAASGAAVAPNTANAASETFEAHAGIPFVGPIIAAGLVLLMLATMAKVKARAVGGLVDKPELTLLGEAGPEVVAPEKDFMDYTRGVFALGNLGANLSYRQAQIEGLNRTAAGYATARPRQQETAQAPAQAPVIQVHLNGPILDSSNRGMQQLGRHVMDAARVAARQIGVTVTPGQTFGGL